MIGRRQIFIAGFWFACLVGGVGLAQEITGNLPSLPALSGVLGITQGGTGGTTATGSGSVVLANTPTLISPILGGATSGGVTLTVPAVAGTNTLTFPAGTTNFTSTGGASQVVQQSSAGGAFTVGQLAVGNLSNIAGGTVVGNPTASPAAPTATTAPVLGRPGVVNGSLGLASATGGTATLQYASAAGNATLTIPATTGNVVTTGDSGTITGAMLASNIAITSSGATTFSNVSFNLTGLTTGTNADFLCLSGAGQVLIQASACTISSLRFKNVIGSYQVGGALDTVARLEPIVFTMKTGERANPDLNYGNVQIGLSAENVAAIEPRCAIWEDDGKTPKSYRQECLIAVLVAAISEQQREIAGLRRSQR